MVRIEHIHSDWSMVRIEHIHSFKQIITFHSLIITMHPFLLIIHYSLCTHAHDNVSPRHSSKVVGWNRQDMEVVTYVPATAMYSVTGSLNTCYVSHVQPWSQTRHTVGGRIHLLYQDMMVWLRITIMILMMKIIMVSGQFTDLQDEVLF